MNNNFYGVKLVVLWSGFSHILSDRLGADQTAGCHQKAAAGQTQVAASSELRAHLKTYMQTYYTQACHILWI